MYLFVGGSGDIHVCWCYFWCTGNREVISNRKETSCLLLLNAGFEPRVSGTESPADWMPAANRLNCGGWSKKLELNLISEHSAHSTPLSTWFYPWLWRYTCLLVLLLMHRQQGSDIELKGVKLSSSAECRIPKSIRSFIIDCEWIISPESLVMVYGNYPRYMITWRLQVDES